MKTTKFLSICLFVAILTACSNPKSLYDTLAELREELATTNDTIYGYSIENGYAIWVHTDEPESGDRRRLQTSSEIHPLLRLENS